MEDKEQIEEITLNQYKMKGGVGFRWPLEWITKVPGLLTGSTRFVHETHEYPEAHYHDYFLDPGESVPICPDAMIVCPCGCGKSFLINKKEQARLKRNLGVSDE